MVGCDRCSLGIEQGALKSVDGALPNVTTSVLTDGTELPSSSQGYSGVDQIVLSTVDAEQLRKLNHRQIAALRRWVEQGGKLFVSMGVNAKTIAETEWLQAMLPSKVRDLQEGIDPGSLESWVNSEKPLPKLICTRLEPCSLVDLTATTIRREPFPLIARHALGLGQVTCLATDLDSSDMLAWPDRNKLLDKLLLGAWKRKGRDVREKDAGSSIGYDDLAGQLRATLDYFPGVQSGSIPLMATLLVAFLLVVGPLDYFIVARHWRRPSWTWGTLLLATVGSSLAIGYLAIQWKPKQLQLNQMVVWDLDWSSRTIRGRAWFHLYSGNQERYDVEANTRPIGMVAPSSIPVGIDWLGLPGNGLGGFDSAVASDRGMPEYRMIRDESKADSMRSIRQLGIPQAGTKTLQGSWSTPWENAPELRPLGIIPGSDMLQGKWKNTLGVDILDGAILFRNWLYALPTRFQPDQEVELSITSQPKDLVRRLQRRRIIEGAERSIPWNPIDRNELERLGEVMLFYKSAGGEGYTSLKHRYIQQIDLSDSLRLDRAIVIGQIKENTLQLSARAEGEERAIADAIHETWIRILIPVAGQQ